MHRLWFCLHKAENHANLNVLCKDTNTCGKALKKSKKIMKLKCRVVENSGKERDEIVGWTCRGLQK